MLRRALRDGNAPTMARWLADHTHRLTEWETDLSSQTGASQAGILLGSNEDISAFRWVEKETATLMTCSAPRGLRGDRAPARHRDRPARRRAVRAARNLLSGEAEDVILTVSRMEAEKKSNPGYRAFLANGDNVTRTLVLFGWEVDPRLDSVPAREATGRAAARAPRRHLPVHEGRPLHLRARTHRFGRHLGHVRGRPASTRRCRATTRWRTLGPRASRHARDPAQARQPVAQIEGRPNAPRPYEIVVLSDHGQTQGATFKQRNGYGLDELVERSLSQGDVAGIAGGDEQGSMVGHAFSEAFRNEREAAQERRLRRDVVVLGSGNLGLVYLMEERRRLTLEEIEARHPRSF